MDTKFPLQALVLFLKLATLTYSRYVAVCRLRRSGDIPWSRSFSGAVRNHRQSKGLLRQCMLSRHFTKLVVGNEVGHDCVKLMNAAVA